jgi:hypothetical protein
VAFSIPAIVVYTNKFEGVFVVSPEAQRYAMWFDEMYLKYYIPGHLNMGCYMSGLIFGSFYHKIKRRNIDINQYKV